MDVSSKKLGVLEAMVVKPLHDVDVMYANNAPASCQQPERTEKLHLLLK